MVRGVHVADLAHGDLVPALDTRGLGASVQGERSRVCRFREWGAGTRVYVVG